MVLLFFSVGRAAMSGEQKSLPTATDGHDTFMFDGIFRDAHSKVSI